MLRKLGEELDRATVIDAAAMPTGVVTLESEVEYVDLATGETEAYVLTLPDRSDIDGRRLSVLAPVGTALIGCRVGDTVKWETPGGVRQLRIRRVSRPAAPNPEPASSLPMFGTT
jgi:regulator of nucleoside diphosphate kinase